MKTPVPPSLTDRCRGLIEAVTGVLGLEQGRGLLAGPFALLMWFRTRRLRKEAAAFAEQFRGLMEQLLALVQAYEAGKLPAPNPLPAAHPSPRPSPSRGEGVEAAARARRTATRPTPHSSAPSAVNTLHRERSEAQASSQAP
ncbi:MAG: hypothetical protein WB444_15975, partial [Gallionella sp.]